MTDMDVDYTLESFRVPDLHPRSQEHPPKSGRVPDLFQKHFTKFLFSFPGTLPGFVGRSLLLGWRSETLNDSNV